MPTSSPDLDFDALRADLARARHQGRTYPPALRAQVLRLVREQQQRGSSAWAVARELGLVPTTVLNWLRRDGSPSSFVPVVVQGADRLEDASFCLLLPGGARVPGLSLDDIAVLCRKVAP
jgi:hypothetical protein